MISLSCYSPTGDCGQCIGQDYFQCGSHHICAYEPTPPRGMHLRRTEFSNKRQISQVYQHIKLQLLYIKGNKSINQCFPMFTLSPNRRPLTLIPVTCKQHFMASSKLVVKRMSYTDKKQNKLICYLSILTPTG